MSGDASTPEQDQTVASGAVPATPESAPDASEATSDQAPAAVDPAERMQQLEQEADLLMSELIETSGSIIGRNGSDASAHGVAMAKDINENAGTTSAQTTLQLRPSFSVQDNADTFALTAATPGLRKDDLAVDVIDGADSTVYLVISGQSAPQKTEASRVAVADDRTPMKSLTTVYRNFERKIRLPADIDRSLIKASYEDGLLTVTIPKTAKKPSLRLRVPIS